MSLTPGARLGPYEVTGSLGAGGMGEVYRARDGRLNRDVALKVLPDSSAADPERLARFEREAQVLASLNHPHIAAIYGLEPGVSASGQRVEALVLELVEGDTLADRIAGGPLVVEDAVSIARQIADALDAAHERGIVHRDLKPANIKVAPNGTVKVLDFGLAKLVASGGTGGSAAAQALSMSPTKASSTLMTGVGVILGTAAYMSPEQAKGREADKRSDVWSFGCVLFEMLSGRKPFEGDDVSDLIAAVLRAEPEWSWLPPTVPDHLRRLIQRCLRRDPARRLRDIGDARIELEEGSAAQAVQAGAEPHAGPDGALRRALPWALAASLATGVLVLSLTQPGRGVPDNGVARLTMVMPPEVQLYVGEPKTMAVSPDGSLVAFIGVTGNIRQIYLRGIDAFEFMPLRNTETASRCCAFSPAGDAFAFVATDGALRQITIADGLVELLAPETDFEGMSWGPDGLVFSNAGDLWQVAEPGAEAALLVEGGQRPLSLPDVLPDGSAVLFESAAWGGSDPRVEVFVTQTGERRTVLDRGRMPAYLPSGHLVFYRDGDLLAAPFDAQALKVTGPAARVIEDIPEGSGELPLVHVSRAGMLAYAPNVGTARLVWVSRQGVESVLTDAPRLYDNPRLDRRNERVLVQSGALWVIDIARSTFMRVAGATAVNAGAFPVLAPDGSRVIYRARGGLRWAALDGSESGEAINGTGARDYPGSISPDGERLLLVRLSQTTSGDVIDVPLAGSDDARAVLETPAYDGSAILSPDGRWLLYTSNDSGRYEVYLRPFPAPDRRWQVSTEGGAQPLWNPNGREIFYRSGDQMLAVAVSFDPDPRLREPVPLFNGPYSYGRGVTIPNYDVDADGQRFVMVKEEANAGQLNLVLNWDRELADTSD